MSNPAYIETWVTAETAIGPIQAAAFVADHRSELIDGDLTFEGQVEYAATGTGILGSSLDYVRGIGAQFRALKIDDPDVTRLLEAQGLWSELG